MTRPREEWIDPSASRSRGGRLATTSQRQCMRRGGRGGVVWEEEGVMRQVDRG